ncbi:hypothetical protein PTTG_00501 [Puccinia triticina 1-1 BBBD Race 1]|uniref:G-patch domain-containing protein n=2 Tax=Puccinia triticina TaxID=208348 RepID=A0A180H3Y7_PUCT1|nr:uncharacterized protein PtA15_2A524 [Puccinia triticina]OAV99710.1 hypothetical protein PTTG_00501 [Puccinia triticina 1-1 BBBD Race 1]WAQ82207.1 hypothetical protein PtA15_2A524 [Puccinia triticina]WAR53063.1 hypothetical protein PtB15_2B492 [Puccinia triticina]
MARKREVILDDPDIDSHSDSSDNEDDQIEFDDRDLQDEHSLFDDPYKNKRNKRRKMNDGKNDAIYGVFATEADQQNTNKPDKRFHRAQAFVQASSSSTTLANETGNLTHTQDEQEASQHSSAEDDSGSDSSDSSDSKSDSVKEIDDPNPPSLSETHTSDLGSRHGVGSSASNSDFRAMLGAGGGLGSRGLGHRSSPTTTGRNGLGSKQADEIDNASKTADQDTLEPAVPRRSFLGAQQSNPSVQPATKKPLSKAEQQHFAKLASNKTSSIGLKMLQNMGWKSGTGLGTQGEGIVTPLETKARPKGMGLSYKGFEERTTQAKEEDRRNGKIVDDEDSKKTSKKKDKSSVREAWKAKPKAPKKTKVVHRTYEQIISELDADQMSVDPGVGEIIDLTGRKLPSLNTTLTHHSRGPTEEEQEHRLPELMHNLALICDISKGSLIHLAKEGQAIKQKSQQLANDQARSEHIVSLQQQKLSKIKRIVELTRLTKATYSNIINQITDNTTAIEICEMIDQFDGLFFELLEFLSDNQKTEHDSLRLDEIVVSALAPILRQVWSRWDVLQQPGLSVKELKRFRKCFRTDPGSRGSKPNDEDEIFQHPLFPTPSRGSTLQSNRKMSAYESLIWNDWLPRIRSAVNVWSPYQSEEMVTIYTSWKPILPPFVHDNFLDQLIVPKLLASIGDWDFREQNEAFDSTRPDTKRVSLHLFVFPWLELVGAYRSELILTEVKLKLSAWLKSWKYTSMETAEEGLMIQDLLVWKKDVLKRRDWDKMILKTVAPHLASYLRTNLSINPKNQNLRPFQVMLNWCQLISNQEILDQLLTNEFFSKWIDTLWIWLTSPSANGDQIGEWYNWWKSLFPESLLSDRSIVSLGFATGQELMNQAKSLSSLGGNLKAQLPKPDLAAITAALASSSRSRRKSNREESKFKKSVGTRLEEITFKSIVEEEVEKKNLFLIPLGKTLDSNGRSLFKVSNQFTPHSGGLIISISDDVVFVKNSSKKSSLEHSHLNGDGDDWEPMLLEDMLEKALVVINPST